MKHIEWILSAFLILLGVLCMALSGMPRLHGDYISFVHICLLVCLYIAIPILAVQFFYFLFFKKRKKD